MSPNKVNRNHIVKLTDLPNIGKAGASDLRLLGINEPSQLLGQNPIEMYHALCEKTAVQHDPCVLDVFLSIIDFINGGEAQPWWAYTPARKKLLEPKG